MRGSKGATFDPALRFVQLYPKLTMKNAGDRPALDLHPIQLYHDAYLNSCDYATVLLLYIIDIVISGTIGPALKAVSAFSYIDHVSTKRF